MKNPIYVEGGKIGALKKNRERYSIIEELRYLTTKQQLDELLIRNKFDKAIWSTKQLKAILEAYKSQN